MANTPLKMRITLGNDPGRRMVYPASFWEHVQSSDTTYVREITYPKDSGLDHGDTEEFVLLLVPTEIAELVLAAPDADQYEELTLAEYDAEYEAHHVRRDFVVDADLMVAIASRISIVGKAGLTVEENQAMDPDHPRRGMTREKKTLAERLPMASVTNTAGFTPRA